jgi:hypothetical protein
LLRKALAQKRSPGAVADRADAHLEQSQQQLGEGADLRALPGQVFGQDGFEFVDRVVRGAGRQSSGQKKGSAYTMPINQLNFSCTYRFVLPACYLMDGMVLRTWGNVRIAS